VGPRGGLEDVEKRKFLTLSGLELRPLGRPARSQSLYRLRRINHKRSDYIFMSCLTCLSLDSIVFSGREMGE
jgi:hypothetical protein